LSRKFHYAKKNVRKSMIGNLKIQPVIGNFTGNWLTDNHITSLSAVGVVVVVVVVVMVLVIVVV